MAVLACVVGVVVLPVLAAGGVAAVFSQVTAGGCGFAEGAPAGGGIAGGGGAAGVGGMFAAPLRMVADGGMRSGRRSTGDLGIPGLGLMGRYRTPGRRTCRRIRTRLRSSRCSMPTRRTGACLVWGRASAGWSALSTATKPEEGRRRSPALGADRSTEEPNNASVLYSYARFLAYARKDYVRGLKVLLRAHWVMAESGRFAHFVPGHKTPVQDHHSELSETARLAEPGPPHLLHDRVTARRAPSMILRNAPTATARGTSSCRACSSLSPLAALWLALAPVARGTASRASSNGVCGAGVGSRQRPPRSCRR